VQYWRTLYGVAWFVWVLDLATKLWAVSTLSDRSNIKILGDFFQLTLVRNPGAAFSIAEGATIFLTLFGFFVLGIIFYYSVKITSKGWSVVLGLAMGGILGNLVDRIFREPGVLRGHVIDWLQVPNFPVFNIADSAIVIAAGISMLLSLRNIAPITRVKSDL
jgi:signal peptidase II